jgi:ribose transport system substrate-binding protein
MQYGGPFVKAVNDSIAEQAAVAGVEVAHCQADFVECFPTFRKGKVNGRKVKAASGVIAFDIGPRQDSMCSMYRKLPTIAIENHQAPCEVAFFGPNEHEAGRLGGAAMGRYAKDNWDCDVTAYVSLEVPAWPINADRMGGFRDGFSESCPIDPATEVVLDVEGRVDLATERVSDLLATVPGSHIVVVSGLDSFALGALDAARTAGREGDVFVGSLFGDESIRKDVACNPQVIASVAYFPERYGRTLIPAMLDVIAGKDVPAQLFIDHKVLDATNIRDIYPETPAC